MPKEPFSQNHNGGLTWELDIKYQYSQDTSLSFSFCLLLFSKEAMLYFLIGRTGHVSIFLGKMCFTLKDVQASYVTSCLLTSTLFCVHNPSQILTKYPLIFSGRCGESLLLLTL
jgi:hypothetical protein